MKSLMTVQTENASGAEQVFCLRQRDSELFWNGREWTTGLPSARGYTHLDGALAIAGTFFQQRIDLLVVFPARQRCVAIPLGSEGR